MKTWLSGTFPCCREKIKGAGCTGKPLGLALQQVAPQLPAVPPLGAAPRTLAPQARPQTTSGSTASNLRHRQNLRCCPSPLNQKLWARGPAVHVVTSPPENSDAHSCLRTTTLVKVHIRLPRRRHQECFLGH